jgi:hypothetical protein
MVPTAGRGRINVEACRRGKDRDAQGARRRRSPGYYAPVHTPMARTQVPYLAAPAVL